MFSARQIERMRATVTSSLPDVCSILGRSLAADTMGGNASVWLPRELGVRCRMSPASGGTEAERSEQGRTQSETGWSLFVPWDTDVRTTDRVSYEQRTYEVTAISADRSWELGKRLTLKEIV